MLIFDAHLDLAWNALEWNRDLMRPVSEIRRFEKQFSGIVPGDATVSWFELRRGRIATVIATVLPRLHRKDKALSFYQSREAGYAACRGQLSYYEAMVERGELRSIPGATALDEHVAAWENDPAGRQPIGYVLSMEGATAVLDPGQVAEWYAAGLRIIGPAHYGENEYCYGTGSKGGLKPDGRELLRQMEQTGMLLDATHLADKSFWDALDVYSGPVLASHHNARSLVPGDRQLTDEQIKTLIERGAVIGASFDCWMVVPGWKIGASDPRDVSLEHIANHTDHICQIAGNARHCGIGSDLDGGFGKEQTPHDVDTVADIAGLADVLDRRGYSSDDIEGIMYKNWVDFFRRAWRSN